MTSRPAVPAWVLPVLLAVLTVAVHGETLRGEFLFDDVRFVRDNPALERIGDPLRFFTDPGTADPTNTPDIYRPLRTLHFAVDRALFGGNPFPYHLQSLLLHAANVLLLFALLRRLGATAAAAGAAAAVFAVHPAQVEAVAWISARADLMGGMFTLLGLLAWLRARPPDRWYAAAVVLGLLAALSREAAVVFPALLVVVDLVRPDGGGWAWVRGRIRLYALPAATAVAYALLARHLLEQKRGLPLGHLLGWWGGSYGANLATAARAAAYSTLHALLPLRPSLDWYLTPSTSPWDLPALAWGVAILVPVSLAATRLAVPTGDRRLAGGVLLAVLAGALTSHVLFPVGIPTAERFLYLPLAGLALAATPGLERLLAVRFRTTVALGTLAVVAMGVSSRDRGAVWRDEETLWRLGPSGVYSPRAVRAFAGGDLRRAADALDRALALERSGREAEGRALLEEARGRIEGTLPALRSLNDFWERSIGVRHAAPAEARARRLLSTALLRSGDGAGALREAREAHRLDPRSPAVLAALAVALHRAGFTGEAGRRMEEALASPGGEVDPESGAAILNGAAEERLRRGWIAPALRALRASARLIPDGTRNGAAVRIPELEAGVAGARAALQAATAAPGADDAAWARLIVFEGTAGGGVAAARDLFLRRFGGAPELPFLRTLWALSTMEADDRQAGWLAAEAWHGDTLARHPGDAGARLGLARCAEALGRRDEARGRFRALVEDPATPADARTEASEGLQRTSP